MKLDPLLPTSILLDSKREGQENDESLLQPSSNFNKTKDTPAAGAMTKLRDDRTYDVDLGRDSTQESNLDNMLSGPVGVGVNGKEVANEEGKMSKTQLRRNRRKQKKLAENIAKQGERQ